MRRLLPIAAVIVCAAVVSAQPRERARARGDVPAAIVELTNAERVRARLDPLRPNPKLMRAAELHAEQMARAKTLGHELPRARHPQPEDRLAAADYAWAAYAENVAVGQDGPAAVMADWMGSRGHRANILNKTFTEMGAARAEDGAGRPYWVQVFGRPR